MPRPFMRRIPLLAALAFLFLACGGDGGTTGPTTDDEVASVVVTGETTVPARARIILSAEAMTAAGDVVGGRAATWSSSDDGVATVSSTGQVRGLVPGTATITATIAGVDGSVEVTVEVADLAALVDSIEAARGMPAMGGAIVSADGLVALGVAGERRAGGPSVTPQDQWHIGSNLKAITAFLAAVAVDAAMLDWSTTIEEMFPEIEVREEYRTVTLRELVTNQSGLPGNPTGLQLQATDARGQRNEVAAWAFQQDPAAERGTFFYSNIGFAMAGAMIERAYDSTYETVIQAELFDPLGVDNAGWGPQTAVGASDNPVPHRWGGSGWVPCEACDNPPWLSAAGRMHIPLGQWARIIQEMLRAENGDSDLVSPATGALLTTGAVPYAGGDEYGYGWVVTSRPWANGVVLVHEGSNTINHSVAWVAHNRDFALLAVTNASDSGGRAVQALDAVVARLLGYFENGQ